MLLCDLVGLGEVFPWTPVVYHPLLFIGRVNVVDTVCYVANSVCAGAVGSLLACGVGMAGRVGVVCVGWRVWGDDHWIQGLRVDLNITSEQPACMFEKMRNSMARLFWGEQILSRVYR